MPRSGLSNSQAKAVADYLSGVPSVTVGASEDRRAISKVTDGVYRKIIRPVENRLPYPTRENSKIYLAAMFGIGIFTGALILAVSFWLFVYRGRRRNRGTIN